MAFKVNKVKADLRSYAPYIIMGQPKVGKSTLFRDLVLLNYKDPAKGLLISMGQEEGYLALDDVNYEEAKTWDDYEDENGNRGLVQIIDEVIETQGTENQIEMVAFDTLDELVEVATLQVYEEHREQHGTYPKSLNDAFGGYQRGQKRVVDLIKGQIARLREAKIAVFIIAHTKVKVQTDIMSGQEYEIVTNNLTSTFYNPVANIAQMIVNIVYDRTIEEKKSSKKDEHDIGKVVSAQRMMVFCNNPFVDAGGRFNGLPEKLPLSAENFMEAFKMGVRESSRTVEMTDEKMKELREAETKENNDIAENTAKKQEVAQKMEIVQEINSLLKASPDKVGTISNLIKEANLKNFSEKEVTKVDISVLEKIREALMD